MKELFIATFTVALTLIITVILYNFVLWWVVL
jgi:hypothetical protein